MKLVELLVKELEEWPEGVTYFVQDRDREVKAGSGYKLIEPDASRIWVRRIPLNSYNFYSSLCTDWKTSIVTKDIYTKHKEETQMKQIIVNVVDLNIEEKQRVNEALSKIANVSEIGNVTTGMAWFYAPSEYGSQVGWDGAYVKKTPTHTKQQVLEMARMEKQGHIHAELMAQYAEDAKTTDKPWDMYQIKTVQGIWKDIGNQFIFDSDCTYRRKPKLKIINGVEVPDISFTPAYLQDYWHPNPSTDGFCYQTRYAPMSSGDLHRAKYGLCYPYTEEGKKAAILHAQAWLGIA